MARKPKSVSLPPPPTFAASARAFAASRKKSFGHDRRLTVGASEVGKCARAVAARKAGWMPDPGYEDSSGFATRGDVMEDAWTSPMVEYHVAQLGGRLLYHGQANQITLKGKGVPLSATPDGLAEGLPRNVLEPYGVPDIESDEAVFEFKSLDPRFDAGKLPKPEHIPQTITQLGMIRRATKHKPLWGAVIYVNASDYFDVNVIPVKYSEEAFAGCAQRATKMLKAKDPNQLPPEGKIAGGVECRTCEFAQRCYGFLPWLPKGEKKLSPKAEVEIAALARKIVHAEAEAERWKREKAEREVDLYLALSSSKTRFAKLPSGGTVLWKTTKPQNRLDTKALSEAAKAAGLDIAKFMKPTKEGTSLSLEGFET